MVSNLKKMFDFLLWVLLSKLLDRKPLHWYSTEKFSICSNKIQSLQILA